MRPVEMLHANTYNENKSMRKMLNDKGLKTMQCNGTYVNAFAHSKNVYVLLINETRQTKRKMMNRA